MKILRLQQFIVASLMLMNVSLTAQETLEDQPAPVPAAAKKKVVVEEESPRDISYLPKPLSDIRCNIMDVERQGYFAIDAAEFRPREDGDEAIVWTVRVKKTVTCRHIESLLREFRDARFIATLETRTLVVLATLVHYSDRISLGASNNKLLRQDDVFELWIDLPTNDLQKLISQDADTLALRRWRY